jgi:hypothetical protein
MQRQVQSIETLLIWRASGTLLIWRASGTLLIWRASGTLLIWRASGTTVAAQVADNISGEFDAACADERDSDHSSKVFHSA